MSGIHVANGRVQCALCGCAGPGFRKGVEAPGKAAGAFWNLRRWIAFGDDGEGMDGGMPLRQRQRSGGWEGKVGRGNAPTAGTAAEMCRPSDALCLAAAQLYSARQQIASSGAMRSWRASWSVCGCGPSAAKVVEDGMKCVCMSACQSMGYQASVARTLPTHSRCGASPPTAPLAATSRKLHLEARRLRCSTSASGSRAAATTCAGNSQG